MTLLPLHSLLEISPSTLSFRTCFGISFLSHKILKRVQDDTPRIPLLVIGYPPPIPYTRYLILYTPPLFPSNVQSTRTTTPTPLRMLLHNASGYPANPSTHGETNTHKPNMRLTQLR